MNCSFKDLKILSRQKTSFMVLKISVFDLTLRFGYWKYTSSNWDTKNVFTNMSLQITRATFFCCQQRLKKNWPINHAAIW